jgi:hypothetical protein
LGFNSTIIHLNYQGPESLISFVARGKLGLQKWTSSPISVNENIASDMVPKSIWNSTIPTSNSSR